MNVSPEEATLSGISSIQMQVRMADLDPGRLGGSCWDLRSIGIFKEASDYLKKHRDTKISSVEHYI